MPSPLFNHAPKSICILRLSAIGDVCNTLAAVQAIQAHWPQTQITWVTGALEAKLLENVTGIELVVFDKKGGLKAYKALWKQLSHHHFDALLHMQYAFRANLATLGIKATHKLGFDAKRSRDFQTLFTNVKVPSPQSPHVLDGLLAFVHQLGIPPEEPSWTLPTTSSEQEWAQQRLSQDKRNLIVVPGASKAYKNWYADGYVDVIKHAIAQGWNVVLAGSPAQVELDLANSIESKLETGVHNLVGKSSLGQLTALLKLGDLVIAPDTGPTHIANALGTPVIGLYAHHNPQRTGPYRYLEYVVSAYQEALWQQCKQTPQEVNWRTRIKDKHAMSLITSKSVIAMFDKAVADFSLLSK
ncbi:glycosyltransferase family 9 protein [Vibrio sp. SCSIO 43136]|uniref:glycosyltransferase family 9 protein n=1 Tax=Vibrio sp. SCSIO 43136 TaxID=2819101 RepID=UPI002074BD00|nr:glycosyltransferase family 9 protein [Vibrio sp. SCSIO 43136]USD65139.1 glycosyltransferase family 9 protein [Vibrio sp. SCSIO 43136]